MQMTAYVVRIGDWSSDVCASDLCVSAGCAPERFGPSPVPYTMLRPRRGLVMIHAFRRSTTSAAALLLLLSVPVSAVAQGLNGRPGVDYYPPWMLDADPRVSGGGQDYRRSEEHTSALQSLMRNSYAVFCLKKKKKKNIGED